MFIYDFRELQPSTVLADIKTVENITLIDIFSLLISEYCNLFSIRKSRASIYEIPVSKFDKDESAVLQYTKFKNFSIRNSST